MHDLVRLVWALPPAKQYLRDLFRSSLLFLYWHDPQVVAGTPCSASH